MAFISTVTSCRRRIEGIESCLLTLQQSLPLLPALVQAKEWCGSVDPLDESRPGSQRGDGVVAGMETWLLLLVDLCKHCVDNG